MTEPRQKMRSENLRAWYGGSEAIKGVTLGIAERRVTAIIGPSGSAGSTISTPRPFARRMPKMVATKSGQTTLRRSLSTSKPSSR